MTVLGKAYTLDDFSKLIFSDSRYELHKSVFSVFAKVESSIDIPVFTAPIASSASTQPFHSKRDVSYRDDMHGDKNGKCDKSYYGPKNGHSHISNSKDRDRDRDSAKSRSKKDAPAEDWGLMRNFKTTKIETKTGVDKTISDLRIHLNKMSVTNYVKQRDIIISEIRQYLDSETATLENTSKISSAIFQIVSTNKFLSDLYSDLYVELIREFSLFDVLLQEFIVSFFETIHTIEYVDPEINYDEFCRITKANDRRKSTTTFISNAMKKGVVPVKTVMELLSVFVDAVNTNIQTPDHAFHAEEITENIFIIISLCFTHLQLQPEWANVFGMIREFSNKKADGVFPSMTNRVLFKFMDILDCVKNSPK